MGTDFPNYYTAAVLIWRHQPLRSFYDWVWFQRQIHYAGIDHQLGSYIPHTPVTMFPFLPLAGLPPQRAKQAWVIAGALFLAGSVLLLAKVSRLGTIEVAVLALLAYPALSSNFRLGQYYFFVLFLLACGSLCLLRRGQFAGGALLGCIFAVKLYTAPFLLYFVARRQWKAVFGFLGAVAVLGVLAAAVFSWSDLGYFATAVLPRAMDGLIDDPYNPGWASMTAFLRRTFLGEPELNPHPVLPSPATFFFLRALYTLGILSLALVSVAKLRGKFEAEAIGWFTVIMMALSPTAASYHFVLLLPAIVLLSGHASWRWRAGLIALYFLTELPLFSRYEALFPKAWLLMTLVFYAGWRFLRETGWGRLLTTSIAVVAASSGAAFLGLNWRQLETPQTAERAVIEAGAIYSSAPVFGANGWLYESIGHDGYVIRHSTPSGSQTFAFGGDAFHPAQSRNHGPVVFELAKGPNSRLYEFDLASKRLSPTSVAEGASAMEPTLSPDGRKIAFVTGSALYLGEGGKRSVLVSGAVSDPQFSPDGQRIVFAMGQPGRRVIQSISIRGGVIEPLVSQSDCFQPAISPDGRLLAVTCFGSVSRQIHVRDLASGKSSQLTQGFCNNDSPAWGADSGSLWFASDCGRGLGLPALYRVKLSSAVLSSDH